MADVIAGRLAPIVANAAVNAGGRLLKVVEMEYQYGKAGERGSLKLASGDK